ncbi:MAG TPA: LON peptidase substrate-binding domain-containing protein, partial [Pseudorhodoferax sp.]|nr:LON peptidase substrate-binding domain-containing protein [Pseudorhodoferax sp.]
MRKILTACVLLAGMVGTGAQATITYTWEATCVSRWTSEGDLGELGCPNEKIKGKFEVGDWYVPGTFVMNNGFEPFPHPYATLVIYDDFHAFAVAGQMAPSFGFQMPVDSGPGLLWWNLGGLRFEQYVQLGKKVPAEVLSSLNSIDEPGRLVDTMAAHMALKIEQKQEIL